MPGAARMGRPGAIGLDGTVILSQILGWIDGRASYAGRRIGTKRISTRGFNAPAILRNIASERRS